MPRLTSAAAKPQRGRRWPRRRRPPRGRPCARHDQRAHRRPAGRPPIIFAAWVSTAAQTSAPGCRPLRADPRGRGSVARPRWPRRSAPLHPGSGGDRRPRRGSPARCRRSSYHNRGHQHAGATGQAYRTHQSSPASASPAMPYWPPYRQCPRVSDLILVRSARRLAWSRSGPRHRTNWWISTRTWPRRRLVHGARPGVARRGRLRRSSTTPPPGRSPPPAREPAKATPSSSTGGTPARPRCGIVPDGAPSRCSISTSLSTDGRFSRSAMMCPPSLPSPHEADERHHPHILTIACEMLALPVLQPLHCRRSSTCCWRSTSRSPPRRRLPKLFRRDIAHPPVRS